MQRDGSTATKYSGQSWSRTWRHCVVKGKDETGCGDYKLGVVHFIPPRRFHLAPAWFNTIPMPARYSWAHGSSRNGTRVLLRPCKLRAGFWIYPRPFSRQLLHSKRVVFRDLWNGAEDLKFLKIEWGYVTVLETGNLDVKRGSWT